MDLKHAPAPLDVFTRTNSPEKCHLVGTEERARVPASPPASLSQSSSLIYSSCEMSHFAALGYPQDISEAFFSELSE